MKGNLYIRSILFTILQPGLVVALIPYFIIQYVHMEIPPIPMNGFGLFIPILFIVGILLLFHCVYLFIKFGKGTLSPLDPTQQLVTSGVYQYSRNPMYLGVIAMLVAENLFFQIKELYWYTLIIFIIFNLFIMLHEEPRLEKDFGLAYTDYKKKVRRWM